MSDAIRLRHELHRFPELSGEERETASRIAENLAAQRPDVLLENLGGAGVAAIFSGRAPGPTVVLRAELDALPIDELNTCVHRSKRPGVAHLCGHDGHMAILVSVGARLALERPARGRVVLLFQPAEETGEGAAAVLDDPRFADVDPDLAFALHNLPGYSLGTVVVREGVFSCASRGMSIAFNGATAHAAQPNAGRSPARAMSRTIEELSRLGDDLSSRGRIAFATVVGARMGEKAFGTAPDRAEIWTTLRSGSAGTMKTMVDRAEKIVARLATEDRLRHTVSYADIFDASVNAPEAVDIVRRAAGDNRVYEPAEPNPWSEDFGRFTARVPGVLFGLGAGEDVADLHSPDYDFPDELISIGVSVFDRIVRLCLG